MGARARARVGIQSKKGRETKIYPGHGRQLVISIAVDRDRLETMIHQMPDLSNGSSSKMVEIAQFANRLTAA